MSSYSAKVIARFWSFVDKTSSPDGCWLWTGALHKPHPYGVFRLSGFTVRAHRFAWELEHGSIPKGLYVLHKPPCDNKRCVRHLYLGTPKQNTADAIAMGTFVPHDNNHHLKYDAATLRALLEEYASGKKLPALARKYGVNINTIRGMLYRQNRLSVSRPHTPSTVNHHSIYTADQIAALRADYATGHFTVAALARKHQMKYITAWQIVRGNNWKHV